MEVGCSPLARCVPCVKPALATPEATVEQQDKPNRSMSVEPAPGGKRSRFLRCVPKDLGTKFSNGLDAFINSPIKMPGEKRREREARERALSEVNPATTTSGGKSRRPALYAVFLRPLDVPEATYTDVDLANDFNHKAGGMHVMLSSFAAAPGEGTDKYPEHAAPRKGVWPEAAFDAMYEAARNAAPVDSTSWRVGAAPSALPLSTSRNGDDALRVPPTQEMRAICATAAVHGFHHARRPERLLITIGDKASADGAHRICSVQPHAPTALACPRLPTTRPPVLALVHPVAHLGPHLAGVRSALVRRRRWELVLAKCSSKSPELRVTGFYVSRPLAWEAVRLSPC